MLDTVLNTRHHFSAGVYAKQMTLAKGHTILCHTHQYAHLSILANGCVIVASDLVETIYTAPACIEISAGMEHSITALETAEWFCIHATSETDVAQIDRVLIGKN